MAHPDTYHQKAYVCIHIFDSSCPVLLVNRRDGDWSFLCGAEHEDSPESYRVIGKGHILDRDPTLRVLDDLAPNWEAERGSTTGAWVCRPAPDDQ